jgi:hypothetical protein
LLLLIGTHAAGAQEHPTSHTGLAAVGALGFSVGRVNVERHAVGFDAGGLIDLGWVRSPRLRLQGEVDYMRASLTQFILTRDQSYHDFIYDLSTTVSAVYLAGGEHQRVVPYLTAGLAVHALSSTFGVVELDQLYNANPFGFHAGAGVRIWLSSSGRNGMFIEGRRVVAQNVIRTSARLGALVFFGDLIHPARGRR